MKCEVKFRLPLPKKDCIWAHFFEGLMNLCHNNFFLNFYRDCCRWHQLRWEIKCAISLSVYEKKANDNNAIVKSGGEKIKKIISKILWHCPLKSPLLKQFINHAYPSFSGKMQKRVHGFCTHGKYTLHIHCMYCTFT